MRESSLTYSNKNNTKNTKMQDIQGGDKKVMKKSLSVILSTAMALSMFSSVAFGKTSADFDDLKDLDAATKAKFDAMIEAGIFEGVAEGTFGLDDNMTRAQFAKVAALIFQLEVDEDLTESSFEDVDGEDEANGWALPYIEAVKAAGITDGYGEGIFNPAGEVTKEQLAAFLIRGLGAEDEAQATPGVSDDTVSDWAKSYVAYAIEKGVLESDGNFDGTAPATRQLLVIAAHGAQEAYVPPVGDKVSVTKAEATGVKTVTVTFNKAVDTTAAKLELKKGTTVIVTEAPVFAENKKSATLTLKDLKLTNGTYAVTLSGLAEGTIAEATASFEAKNEEVTKIDFVNATDTVAQADTVKIKLQATNQYGEKASANAGSYTAYSTTPGDARVTKSDSGDLYIIVDTKDNTLTANLSSFSVNIYNNESRVSASKTFKIGLPPMVTKVELTDVKYGNGKDGLTNAGDQAIITMVQIDQYGQEISQQTGNAFPVNVQVTPNFNNQYTAVAQDKNNDNIDEIVVTLNSKATVSGEQTVTVFGGGSTATAKISVKAVAVPAKVEFGELTGTYADGDTNKYVTLNLYDAEGNLLSPQDVVDNVDRLTISGSGNIAFAPTLDVPAAMFASKSNGTLTPIIAVGENKGKIHIASLTGKGTANIFAYTTILENGATSNTNLNLPIVEARYPVTMTVATDPATKAVETATTKVKLNLIDQYGDKLETMPNGYVTENYGSRSVTYDVYVSTDAGSDVDIAFNLANGDHTIGAVNDNEFTFTFNANTGGGSVVGSKKVTFALRKLAATVAGGVVTKGAVIDENVKSITKEVTVIDPNATGVKLTYAAGTVTDLFNAEENTVLSGVYDAPTTSKHAKKIAITAKDSSGATVAVPKSVISVTSDNENVAKVGVTGDEAYVIGNKVGTAKISVSYKTAKGEIENKTVDVTVKNDPISVASIAADKKTHKVVGFSGGTTYAYKLMNKVTVKDQYGSEYKSETITGVATDIVNDYNKLLGIQYLISEVKGGTVDLNTDGRTVTMSAGVTSFVIQAVSPSGKIATTQVVIDAAGTNVAN
jgi:hypothetical protein